MVTQQEIRPAPDPATNPYLRALIFDFQYVPGTVITYVLQGNPGDNGLNGGALWATDGRAAAFALALQQWSNVANLTFVQANVAYTGTGSTAAFDWIETLENLGDGILGQHDLPFPGTMEGNYNLATGAFSGDGLALGGLGFVTFIHELGHALGLLHPHLDGGGGFRDYAFPGVTDPFNSGSLGLNQGIFTTMSYNDGYAEVGLPLGTGFGLQSTPGAFDIAAIQLLYGANPIFQNGASLYNLPQANVVGTSWQTIWDTGGSDTLSAAGAAHDAYFDLRAATLLQEFGGGGFVSRVSGIMGGFTIANGVVIENATGGNGDDMFIGNSANNALAGGVGFDTVSYAHISTGVTVNLQTGVATGNGTDTLTFMEGAIGGAGNDTLTARNQTSTVRGADLVIRDPQFAGGQTLQTAISLNNYFGLPINAPASAATGTGTLGVATVDAVGRGSVDYYSFMVLSASAGAQIVIDIDDTFALDTLIRLRDANGNIVATSDDIGPNLDAGSAAFSDSRITFTFGSAIASPQTFTIEVGRYSSSGPAAIGAGSSYTMHVAAPSLTAGIYTVNGMLDGGDGDDTLFGGTGNDHLIGGDGNDTLHASGGIDRMEGGFGDDTYLLTAAAGADDLVLDLAGQDTIIASFSYTLGSGTGVETVQLASDAGAASLTGNAENNILRGNNSDNVIYGLDGNDTLYGEGGTDYLYGGAGNDSYYLSSPDDLAFEDANSGTDTLYSPGDQYLYANIENLTLTGGDGFGVGTGAANIIRGSNGVNLILGGGGLDRLSGFGGNDSIFGEAGNDDIDGGQGIDYLVGGNGNDRIEGEEGADAIYGEDGDDILASDGQLGLNNFGVAVPTVTPEFVTDIIVGGAGNDTIYGNSGLGDYDLLYGNTGNDTFYVDTPDDLVFEQAGEGIDTVIASINGAGYYLYENIENLTLAGATPFGVGNGLDNILIGAFGDNYLLGGAGDDTLNGKENNDVLFGEGGNDTFVFEQGTDGDVIGDFATGDRIDLTAFDFASFAALQTLFIQNGDVGAINLGNGDLVVLHNVQMAQLTAADFLL